MIVSRHSHASETLPVYFSIDVNPPGAQGQHLRQSPVQRMLDMGKWKKESAPRKRNLPGEKMERERCKSSSIKYKVQSFGVFQKSELTSSRGQPDDKSRLWD